MNVLILGGTSLTGPFIVRELCDLGHQVVVFHRGQTEPELPPDVRHIHGEHQRLADFAGTLRDFAPEVVVDMVAEDNKDGSRTMDLFRGVSRRIVAISSGDVYRAYDVLWGRDIGDIQPTPLGEDSQLRSSRFPDKGTRDKILVEHLVMSDPELPGTILRYPMVYGPNDGGRIIEELRRMDDGRPAILMDEAMAGWRGCWGYVENMAHAVLLAVTMDQAAGRVYNVADAEAPPMEQWVEEIGEVAGWNGRVVPLPRVRLPAHLTTAYNFHQHWELDTTRIREELGYADAVDRPEAMRRTVAWWRQAFDRGSFDASYAGDLPNETAYEAEDEILRSLDRP